MGRNESLSFWLNAYNALAIKRVRDNPCKAQFGKYCWPIKGIRDTAAAFGQVWNQPAGVVGAQSYTLSEIETMLRGLGDPRVLASIVSAAVSSPDIRPEAFYPGTVEPQLTLNMQRFLLNTRKGLQLTESGAAVEVSAVFNWYATDFNVVGGVRPFLAAYGPDSVRTLLSESPEFPISYFGFDWQLNALTFSHMQFFG